LSVSAICGCLLVGLKAEAEMAQSSEQQKALHDRIEQRMNEPYVPVRDPLHMPPADERVVQALEYIAYQMYKIRRTLEK
jgi:hypothetical protein